MGFANMIVSARQAIEENAGLVEDTFWIVDEFQDFNRAEEHLIRVLTDDADGVLIAGDDEQALYQQLKGATPKTGPADEGDASVEGAPALAAVEVVSLVGAKGLSARHVIVLGCDTTNMGYATTLQFYVALSRARKSLHLITALKAKGASEVHPYV